MENPWMFTENVFENRTRGNYLRMLKISTYHKNALEAQAGDAYFDQLILDYAPLHSGYVGAYTIWQTSIGTAKGGTTLLDQLLSKLSSTEIRKWDVAIQNVYPEGSPQYVALLPNQRKPFQSGPIEDRIAAVQNLSLAIGTDIALAAVKALVDAFHTQVLNARNAQQGKLSHVTDFSEDVEEARVAAAGGQYRSLGSLMNHFYQSPAAIEPFFDLENIRTGVQESFTGTSKAKTTGNIFKRTLEPDDKVRIINDGNVPLTFGIVPEKNDAVTTPSLTVQAGEEEIVTASTLGNVPSSTYMNVTNDDPSQDGHFTVELI